MKNILILSTFFFSSFILHGQEKLAKKPQYLMIINNEISTKEQVDEYFKKGYIKSMNKGVSEAVREELAKRFGNKIGDKEFIIIISLYSESERLEMQGITNSDSLAGKNTTIDSEYKLQVNDTARQFTVQMIDGSKVNLSDLKGKIVLLNFWATWCAPCLMEFYDIPSKILEPFKNDKLVFLPISIGENEEKVAQKMKKLEKDGVDFRVGVDPDEVIWSQYAIKSIPKNFLIDQNGIIKYTSTGNMAGGLDKLAIEIKKLLTK